MLFASPRDSTRLNDYSHLRGFRRVGVERVELLICLNNGTCQFRRQRGASGWSRSAKHSARFHLGEGKRVLGVRERLHPVFLVRPVKLALFLLLVTGLASLFAGAFCSPFGFAGPARLELLDRQTGQSSLDTQ
jgi:hypothetical protein